MTRTELLGIGYWGFWNFPLSTKTNYINVLQDINNWQWACGCVFGICTIYCPIPYNQVFYAQVGPVSSNWDRACELYAQITGTQTDYGYWHSLANNHARFGPNYSGNGFLPTWGTNNKIAFVGHSMGGQTIRWLEWMLQNGAASEKVAYPAGQPAASPLFTGSGRNWIKSVHTISTPHNGSPLYTALVR